MTNDATNGGDGRPTGRPADAASPAKVDWHARRYEAEGRPFARVTVVRREPPVSANVGDRALVTPDGDMVGWIGGAACAQSIVAREAAAALERGDPVLLGLAPDPETVDRPGVEAFPMTCASGGSLELFVEPVLPIPGLVVVGDSPVALALSRLANELTYEVTVVGADLEDVPDADRVITDPRSDAVVPALEGAGYVVVASMGAFDDVGLDAAMREDVRYVGLVASEPRASELFERVAQRVGGDPDDIADAVTTPAGLDIEARTPEEVAVSVLAELVAVRQTEDRPRTRAEASSSAVGGDDEPSDERDDEGSDGTTDDPSAATSRADDPPSAVDPVCGMTVEIGSESAAVEFAGETYHFCAEGCAEAFSGDPERYVDAVEGET